MRGAQGRAPPRHFQGLKICAVVILFVRESGENSHDLLKIRFFFLCTKEHALLTQTAQGVSCFFTKKKEMPTYNI